MYAAVEIGGTNTRVAVTNDLSDIGTVKKFISDHDIIGQKKSVQEALRELSAGGKIDAAVLGIPGVVDRENVTIIKAPNYPSLNGLKAEELLGPQCLGAKIVLENDAAMAALGEATLGAGKTYKNVTYISLGTGVGMVKVVDKKLDPNQTSYEFGHQIINWNACETDGYGFKGSFESYVSGLSFRKIYKMDPMVCKDTTTWLEYGKALAIGIVNISLAWNSEAVVIGGGIAAKFDNFYLGIEEGLKSYQALPLPAVIRSVYGDGSGVIGGFVLLSQRL